MTFYSYLTIVYPALSLNQLSMSSVSTGKDGAFKVSSISSVPPGKEWWGLTSPVPDTHFKSKEEEEIHSNIVIIVTKGQIKQGPSSHGVWGIIEYLSKEQSYQQQQPRLSDTCNKWK